MTNVKFRAWDTQTKQYVRIDSIQFDHLGNGEPVTLKSQGVEWSIKRFVLEQWTGLKDKNGREIFQGDIVEESTTGTRGLIEYDVDTQKYYASEGPFTHEDLVIGNVHENGELLK